MPTSSDNETWLVETGDAIIGKKTREGADRLSPWETLVHRVWVCDYAMRNAGDLDVAEDLCPGFHAEARRISGESGLPVTHATFSLANADLEREWIDRFDAVVEELRGRLRS
jgi:hypothetical protein